MNSSYETIIIGAGFGGLNAAIKLGKADRETLIIDKHNHHLFQPLLYQVATAGLSPADIATPIREILKPYKSVSVMMDEVTNISKENNEIKTLSGAFIKFKYLIIAIGARHSYFGHDEWELQAPGLKSLEDALRIRENVLRTFEIAERKQEEEISDDETTFVIIGGGPTGVEMAGAISEIAKKTLLKNFKKVDPNSSRIILIEAGDRLLSTFDPSLSAKATSDLRGMGVEVYLSESVVEISKDLVKTDKHDFKSKNIIWAAGNKGLPLLIELGVELDKAKRVVVDNDCSIPGSVNIFAIGDAAAFKAEQSFLPGLAPVAMQQGEYVGAIITKNLDKTLRKPFVYFDKGSMATIGKSKAILQFKNLKISGLLAWLAWCLIHLLFLVRFRNKVIILMEWIYYYFTGQRGSRLIRGELGKDND